MPLKNADSFLLCHFHFPATRWGIVTRCIFPHHDLITSQRSKAIRPINPWLKPLKSRLNDPFSLCKVIYLGYLLLWWKANRVAYFKTISTKNRSMKIYVSGLCLTYKGCAVILNSAWLSVQNSACMGVWNSYHRKFTSYEARRMREAYLRAKVKPWPLQKKPCVYTNTLNNYVSHPSSVTWVGHIMRMQKNNEGKTDSRN